jgi:hypothetical protein
MIFFFSFYQYSLLSVTVKIHWENGGLG